MCYLAPPNLFVYLSPQFTSIKKKKNRYTCIQISHVTESQLLPLLHLPNKSSFFFPRTHTHTHTHTRSHTHDNPSKYQIKWTEITDFGFTFFPFVVSRQILWTRVILNPKGGSSIVYVWLSNLASALGMVSCHSHLWKYWLRTHFQIRGGKYQIQHFMACVTATWFNATSKTIE